MLSGYGLYYGHTKGGKSKSPRRILRLFITYWLSLALFVGVGSLVYPGTFEFAPKDILINISAFHTTWNITAWFLFPCLLLVFTTNKMFTLLDKWGTLKMAIVSVIAYLIATYLIKVYYSSYFSIHYAQYQIMLYIYSYLSFIVGAMFCRHSKEALNVRIGNWLPVLLFFSVMLSRSIIGKSYYAVPSTMAVVIFFTCMRRPIWCDKLLAFFGGGRYSTEMWLVHAYFCYYLFHDFIYGFRYPAVIFVVTTVCSLLTAIALQKCSKGLYQVLDI